ncbi:MULTISPECIES: ACP S-malonyltransferase [Thiorhodovibrio]|uniref:ACP S-malonyltransferase n=1 Tax=Thiorhodovibrio TaxID=61593 RepID=UPI00191164EB|nr:MULTISPECIES: ACP S-malonyltransferase [Thiorhodovibrio]MBK5969564.1 [acyl-carrier-protein] S-malonyltransferase [Thiorhodovibrio winogradskyi]WPL13936.1 Malonyl CoA-acyl carrier protein transacylase [Thiorhodovibrio litoralis]
MSKRLAFVFPGQGSQSVGMLSDLAVSSALVGETFAEVSEVLGRDLWSLVSAGPGEELDQTQNTQPAMLAAGVAVWRCWRDSGGPMPEVMAGHSLGEYSALVCAGALELTDAARLVAERARLMQEATPAGVGAMAAILGLADEQVVTLCAAQAGDQVLEAVNFNSPGQVVIAGEREAVERALPEAKALGAKRALLLPVSVPSHCALMRPAAEQLQAALDQCPMRLPEIPVIHNASVSVAEDVAQLRGLLAQQLYRPVRWVETIQAIGDRGVESLIESGPGKVLAGLGKRIDKTRPTIPVVDAETLKAAMADVG